MTRECDGHKDKHKALTEVNIFGVDKLELPKEYKSWKDAIGDFVEARGQNKTPDELDAHTWKAFETFAIKLVPRVSAYVNAKGGMNFL
jgi:hypothetical protein